MISSLLMGLSLQLQVALPPVFNARDGRTDVRLTAPEADSLVTVDGRLNEAVWQRAALLTGFSLYQPVDGRPAPDSTEVRVWYSSTAIFFGIRAFEPHGAVRATLADRDRVGSDDYVEIHLDTFSERRRAFVFIVNPLGIQADGTKTEGGGFIPGSNISPGQNDLSADFIWQSKGHVEDWGYEVEVRIPFNSLRYPAASEHRWGLQFSRHVQHSGYDETWTPVKKASSSFIAQEGWIGGLRDIEHGSNFTINPEATSTISGSPNTTANAANDPWSYSAKQRVGGNVRLGLGSNFVLNGTVKPDFSQVEADAAQVAADPRFALFYAERRPFFVEGAELFNVPNTLVYTRRIVNPDGALKLTGKLGGTNVALLSALDAPTAAAPNDRPLVDILRLTRDFGEQSTVGLLYSERVRSGRTNRSAGLDTRYVFGQLYYAQLQFATSNTNTAGTTNSGSLWEGVVDRTGRRFGFHYGMIGIAPNFQADNGFVSRTGYVQPSANNRFTLFGKPGGVFERYNVFVTTTALWKYESFAQGDSPLETRASLNNSFTFRRGWSLSLTPAFGSFAFDPGAYTQLLSAPGVLRILLPFVPAGRTSTFTTAASLSTPQFRRFAASAGMTLGNDVYFLETSKAWRTAYNASLDVRPNDRIRFNATYVSTRLTRRASDDVAQSSRIPRVKLEYQIARPLFVRLVAQYEATLQSELRDPRTGLVLWQASATPLPTRAFASNTLRADWLVSYRPRPGFVLFAGYGNTMAERDPLAFDRLRRVSDGFFTKASYVFGQMPR